MPLVLLDEDVLLPGMPNAAGAGFYGIANALPRVFVIDDVDATAGWGYTSAGMCDGADAGTLTLVYNDTLARVEITGSNINPFTAVKLERSTDQQHWTTVRGGGNIPVVSNGFTLNDYEFTPCVTNYYRITSLAPVGCATSAIFSITPALTQIWFKSVTRPFLNIPITVSCAVTGAGDTLPDIELFSPQTKVSRAPRTGVFPIINRTLGVAVNDLRTGRAWDIMLRTRTKTALQSVDFLLASGDVILIQVPEGCVDCGDTVEHGYVTALDAGYTRHFQFRQQAVWDIGLLEVAAPGPDIIYAEATWQTVLNLYGSWAAVMAANPTWAAVLALLPSPSEVIVG